MVDLLIDLLIDCGVMIAKLINNLGKDDELVI